MELELCAVTTSGALNGAENKTITLINLVGICFKMAAYVNKRMGRCLLIESDAKFYKFFQSNKKTE